MGEFLPPPPLPDSYLPYPIGDGLLLPGFDFCG